VNGLRLGLENPRNAVLGDIARHGSAHDRGIVTGTTLLVNLPRNASLIALGAFVLGYAIYSLSRRGAPAASAGTGRSSPDSAAAFGNALRAGGPPYAIYLSTALSKEQFRATMTLTHHLQHRLRLVAFAVTGLMVQDAYDHRGCGNPGRLFAIYLAVAVFRVISGRW